MPRSLIVLTLLPACFVVGDTETETESFTEDAPFDRVVIELDGGDVLLNGDAAATTASGLVTATFTRDLPDVAHYVEAGALYVTARCDGLQMVCAVDLELTVPEGVPVTITTGSGDVEVCDLAASVRVDTGAGDVRLTGIAGDVEVESGAGDVFLDECAGDVRVESGAGDVQATRLTGADLSAETGAGDISLRVAGPFERLDADSGTGDVVLGVPAGAYRLRIESGAGDVDVSGVTDDPDAASIVSASTGAGDIAVLGS